MKSLHLLSGLAFSLAFVSSAQAQVSVTTLGAPVTQNFDTLLTTGSATFTNNSTVPGWFHARTGTGTTIVANDGASNGGNLYSYGTGTTTDRALGTLGSGNAAVGNLFYGIRLQNNSGATITSLQVSYTGEQWRNSAAAAQTAAFSYLIGAPTVTGSLAEFQSAGVAVAALDFTSPITGGTAGALNGNLAANRVALSSTITGLTIPNGTEIMLRWSDPDHTGADHGLSIDDVSITPLGAGLPTATVVSLTRQTASPTNLTTPVWQIVFSQAIDGLSAGNFNIVQTGLGGTQVLSAVATSGPPSTTWNLSVATVTGSGPIRLDLVNDTGLTHDITNLPFTGETTDIDQTAPTLTSILISDTNLTGSDTATVTFDFDEPVLQFDPTDVTVPNATLGPFTPSNGGRTHTSTLTPLPNTVDPTNVLTVNMTAITDAVTNPSVGTVDSGNYAIDTVPRLSITDVTQVEFDSGTAEFSFVVNLDAPAPIGGVSFDVSTADNTATSPADYLTLPLTPGVIPAGTMSLGVAISVVGDTIDEANHTFFVNVTNVVGAIATDAQGLGTITDDDNAPTYSFATLTSTVAEGNAGSANHNIALTLSNGSESTLSVRCVTFDDGIDDTATGGTDYTDVDMDVTFAPGTTSQPFIVPILGDTTPEPDETFSVGCYGFNRQPNGLPPVEHTVTLGNDDTIASIAVAPAAVIENSGTAMVYTITLAPAPTTDTTVNFTLAGTATSGTDYPTPGALSATVLATQTTASVSITPTGDTDVEANETIVIDLAAGSGYTIGSPASATGTINNDDISPSATVTVAPASAAENSGTAFVYTVSLSPAPAVDTTVNFTLGGSAASGTDYPAPGVLSVLVPNGQPSANVSITPTGDTSVEPDETIILTLAAGSGYTVYTPDSATATIMNDDSPVASIAVAPPAVAENSGTALVYTITLTPAPIAATTVDFVVAGTATSGTDYPAPGSLSAPFAIGQATATVSITPTGDTAVEPDETVQLTLAAGSGYTIGAPAAATGRITNDDSSANLSFASVTDTPDPVLAGGNITYSIVVNNAGPDAAGTVQMDFPLPAGLTFVSATGPGWACGAPNVTCTIGSLPVGNSTITIVATVPGGSAAGTIYSGTATLTSTTPDPDPANNTAAMSTTVGAGAPATPVPSLDDWSRLLLLLGVLGMAMIVMHQRHAVR